MSQKYTFDGRLARALVEAEAEAENEEKLGEAAIQFFYGNKVPKTIQKKSKFKFVVRCLSSIFPLDRRMSRKG